MAGAKEQGRSKDSLIAIWVGKQTKPEVERWAAKESERTGMRINANGLAKEIFLSAFEAYKVAGSLARFKAWSSNVTKSTGNMEPNSHISKRAGDVTKEATLNSRLRMGTDIIGTAKAKAQKPKTDRSKTS